MIFSTHLRITRSHTRLFFILFCSLSMVACTSGDSATTSGGPSFTNVAGNWQGEITASDNSSPATLLLSIVLTSDDIINGVATIGDTKATCLTSGTLTGTAANGFVTFTVTNNVSTTTFAGTASITQMLGTFVASSESSTSTDSSTTEDTSTNENFCNGMNGSWSAHRL
ncbi:MAG: hypothetical protein GKR95_12965 [Gammaproteobacteria bacterium]|nr:hypothetical protein [Gammaproteobacteria bacterium]NKB62980.1 hypothetical protein [Gammaproteobacteria bacterium]